MVSGMQAAATDQLFPRDYIKLVNNRTTSNVCLANCDILYIYIYYKIVHDIHKNSRNKCHTVNR